MVNPEHVKIVKAGRVAISEYLKDNPEITNTDEVILDLSGADLHETDLHGAWLRQADLTEANLEGAKLIETDLLCAILKRANLKDAFLSGTSFSCAKMDYANFEDAKFGATNFSNAELRYACFRKTQLDDVNFTDADLSNANLSGAHLTRTIFLETKLHNTILNGIYFDNTVTQKWDITNVECNSYWTFDREQLQLDDESGRLQKEEAVNPGYKFWIPHYVINTAPYYNRIPTEGFLAPGKFEQRFGFGLSGRILGLNDEWITITMAASLAVVNPGTISRWAEKGEIKCNGKKGRERRVLKSSVLLKKAKREDEDRRKDTDDVLEDMTNNIPDMH